MILRNILIGEDIRQEIGNKVSLMGILGDSIEINVPPNAKQEQIPVNLAFLITIENTNVSQDPKDFTVSITMSLGEKQFGKLNARVISADKGRISHLPLPKIGLQLAESTILTIQAKIMKKEKVISENTATLNINLNRIPMPQTT